jgi:hypothetical protein
MRITQTKNKRGWLRRYELDSFVPGYGQSAGSSDDGNNFRGCTEVGKLLVRPNDHYMLTSPIY